MERPLNESVWRRGCHDAKAVWTSTPFLLFDAVVCVVVGGVFGWGWGVALFAFAFICVWLGATVRAPIKQRNEARDRVGVLEDERIPCITAKPRAGRRQYGSEHEYLLWAELLVTNTSPSQSLSNVEVRLTRCQDVIFKQDSQGEYWLRPDYPAAWNPTSVYWSERDASAHEIHVSLGPGGSKSALVSAQNNPNSSTLIFNSITSPQRDKPAKVDIEITSLESAPLKRSFYIECTPNWFGGPEATMVFIDWDDWASNQYNAPSIPDTEDSPSRGL